MNRKILTIFLLLIAFFANATTSQLTNNSKIVLFTCDKGPELYAGFGHSAIWVSDSELGVDRLYNYGTFDFDTPNFYLKFIRGKLDYMLSVTTLNRFLKEYSFRKIGVIGQELDLTLNEKQKIFNYLENNYLPQNRFYKYDFFYDNCATRIRDVVYNNVDSEHVINMPAPKTSFREMLFPYLDHTPWTKFGINLILGLSADKIVSISEGMYLPNYMNEAFGNTQLIINDNKHNLIGSTVQFLLTTNEFKNNSYDDPIIVFSLILIVILVLSYFEYKTGFNLRIIDNFLFFISSLAGTFLMFMWLGTDHSATNENMNILWMLPAQLIFFISKFISNKKYKLLLVALIYQVIVCFSMFFWPQDIEFSFFIIALIFVVRLAFNAFRKK